MCLGLILLPLHCTCTSFMMNRDILYLELLFLNKTNTEKF